MMWLWIALGGAFGASLRHGLTPVIPSSGASGMPWATLLANVLGCSLMGICFALLQRDSMSEPLREFLMVGLLGSLTTFSAYSQQLFELIEGDRWGLALSYGAGSVFVCLTAFCLSIWGVRALLAY
jgi:CrcB protein